LLCHPFTKKWWQDSKSFTAVFILIECPNPKCTLGGVLGSAEGKIIDLSFFWEYFEKKNENIITEWAQCSSGMVHLWL